MILSTDQQAQLEHAIQQKFGKDAVKDPKDFVDRIRRKEITTEFQKDQERWEEYDAKEEITDMESFVIIDKKASKKEPLIVCKTCKKESIVFTSKDYFYSSKHGCCELCFYAHHQ